MTEDKEAQEDELLALASIYDENVFESSQDGATVGGRFNAHLDLPEPITVKMGPCIIGGKEMDVTQKVHYLPPVTLYFEFPKGYPSSAPPTFSLSCQWLSLQQLSLLCQKLDELAKEYEGEVILFIWTSFLKDETLDFLSITSPLDLSNVVHKRKVHRCKKRTSESVDNENETRTSECDNKTQTSDSAGESDKTQQDPMCPNINDLELSSEVTNFDSRAMQDVASQDLLWPILRDHDDAQKQVAFQGTLFTCPVCFVEKLGSLCMSFSGCGHTYCKDCMKGYFTVQINDGSVKAMTCPDIKCESQANPSQVKDLVSEEEFKRYDRLLLQSSLDTMSDIVYCPRKACGCAVLIDDANNTGTCPSCCYVFCIYCKLSYHGVAPCRVNSEDIKKLREEYMAASPEERKLYEKRYGRRTLQQLIEESFTQEWLVEYSKRCPHCKTHIQKIDGCNKMTCTKCRAYFCWLCEKLLNKANPYSHFNVPGNPCFNRLFQGVIMNDDEFFDEEEEPFFLNQL